MILTDKREIAALYSVRRRFCFVSMIYSLFIEYMRAATTAVPIPDIAKINCMTLDESSPVFGDVIDWSIVETEGVPGFAVVLSTDSADVGLVLSWVLISGLLMI